MFDQNKNRVDYGDLLSAGIDYELDQAVGFTYSLDMEALMGIPLSLEMHEEMTTGLKKNILYVLESIRRIKKKLSIFCNVGCIKVPEKDNKLYALLEDCIHEVRMPNYNYNFHPKLWILQYHNIYNNKIIIKVVTLSRNLTFDQSLDVAVEMEGEVGKEINTKNQPLVDLITFASQFDSNKNIYNVLKSNVSKVKKFNLDNCFDDYEFRPFGIYGKTENGIKKTAHSKTTNYKSPIDIFKDCNSLFVVSPFLSEEIITNILSFKDVQSDTGPINRCLITRESSVTEKIIDAFNNRNGGGVWTLNAVLCSNENLEDETIFGQSKRDIHAKIYFTEKNGEPKKMYLGSLNASNNAFYNNVEFLLELSFKKHKMGYKTFYDDFFMNDKNTPFIRMNVYNSSKDDDNDSSKMREEIYGIESAKVIEENDSYSIIICCKKSYDNVTIKPFFMRNNLKPMEKEVKFSGMTLKNLSNMFILTKENEECIVRLEVDGMPNEERECVIFNDIIENRANLMTYMKYLLDEDYDGYSITGELGEGLGEGQLSADFGFLYEDDLYERMLKALVAHPERIDSMFEVVEKMDKNKVDSEFFELLELFKKAKNKSMKSGGKAKK